MQAREKSELILSLETYFRGNGTGSGVGVKFAKYNSADKQSTTPIQFLKPNDEYLKFEVPGDKKQNVLQFLQSAVGNRFDIITETLGQIVYGVPQSEFANLRGALQPAASKVTTAALHKQFTAATDSKKAVTTEMKSSKVTLENKKNGLKADLESKAFGALRVVFNADKIHFDIDKDSWKKYNNFVIQEDAEEQYEIKAENQLNPNKKPRQYVDKKPKGMTTQGLIDQPNRWYVTVPLSEIDNFWTTVASYNVNAGRKKIIPNPAAALLVQGVLSHGHQITPELNAKIEKIKAAINTLQKCVKENRIAELWVKGNAPAVGSADVTIQLVNLALITGEPGIGITLASDALREKNIDRDKQLQLAIPITDIHQMYASIKDQSKPLVHAIILAELEKIGRAPSPAP